MGKENKAKRPGGVAIFIGATGIIYTLFFSPVFNPEAAPQARLLNLGIACLFLLYGFGRRYNWF